MRVGYSQTMCHCVIEYEKNLNCDIIYKKEALVQAYVL